VRAATSGRASKSLGRLTGRNRYAEIFANRRSARSQHLQMYVGKNIEGVAMLGIGVAKSVAKHATARNYMRRALREEMRLRTPKLVAVELVILVRQAFDHASRRAIDEELGALLVKLRLCAAS
jgi:ribonuclease P protein component